MSGVQVILEHQLAELVAEWSDARERKRKANQEFNEEIKDLEERIDGLLGEIKVEQRADEAGQQRLPFDRPHKPPTILPAEEPLSDPDLQALATLARLHGIVAARRNENGSTTFTLRADSGFESTITLRKNEHGAIVYDSDEQAPPRPDTPAQGVGEADDPTTAHTEEQEEAAGDPTSAGEAASSEAREEQTCATCTHTERVHGTNEHGDPTGCMAIDCRCRRFVPRDLLGVDDWDPQAQEGGELCDSAS